MLLATLQKNLPPRGSVWIVGVGGERIEVEILGSGHGRIVVKRLPTGEHPLSLSYENWLKVQPVRKGSMP